MKTNPTYRWRSVQLPLFLVLLIPLLGLAVPGQAASVAAKDSETAGLDWYDACRRIVSGHVDTGAETLRRLVGRKAMESDRSQVRTWLEEYEGLQKQRDRFRKADHEYEMSLAAKAAEKKEWLVAMRHLVSAFDTAKETDAFLESPEVARLVEQGKAQADALSRKGEWTEAAGIYACLEHCFEKETEYRDLKRKCLRHARLEVIYEKDEEKRWRKMLKGIEPSMVHDAFQQVQAHYVREANFKKALEGGIENLRILATTTELANTFPGIGDKEANVRFRGEITTLSRSLPDKMDESQARQFFDDLLKINRRTIQLPESLLITEFMDGALRPLDRFSSMIWPADVEEFRKHTMGRFQGVGIQIRKDEDKDSKLLVVSPLPGTPAHRAGIMPGDVILKVNGEDIAALKIDEIVPRIMGPKGTKVTLTIQRGKNEPFDVAIERDVIVIKSVRGFERDEQGNWKYMIDPQQRIGYIRIDPSFTEGTVHELKSALKKLEEEGARALILDLRFNPGGLLRAAIDVTELFLPPGKGIVSTRGQHSEDWARKSTKQAYFDKDMIVLVNETSASASEILAGALQDNQRAIVLGMRTHGKGSVQNLIPLSNQTAYLKLTTALYYLPSNRCPDKHPEADEWGVTPDIEVSLRPEERIKIIQMRRDADILGELPPNLLSTRSTTTQAASETQPATQPDVKEPMPVRDRPDVDPQTEAALLVLRVKLLTGQPWGWSVRTVSAGGGSDKRVQ